jgi:hypothetical protein
MSAKRRPPALPRRPWFGPDKLRAAYLAGQGMSAGEIARVIGGTTGQRVRAMLRVYGIPLQRDRGNMDILQVVWKRGDRAALDAAADRLDRDPGELAALIVRKVIEGKKIESLVDGLDVIG